MNSGRNKSASAWNSPDKQMFFPQRSPLFDFIEERLFDLEGLGAGTGRRPALLTKVSTLRLFYSTINNKKAACSPMACRQLPRLLL
ncbi:hypothetical protein F9802_00225 [Bacillus aerolatus]|uniref:Uncharacterized protein n=1 Tax=Bacillus aerolatus TaxID=2653354 RepID=A0A6I1FPK9_9BACI|nr:hypothetical protein F9802_00225 [Bacillus aerolatus]